MTTAPTQRDIIIKAMSLADQDIARIGEEIAALTAKKNRFWDISQSAMVTLAYIDGELVDCDGVPDLVEALDNRPHSPYARNYAELAHLLARDEPPTRPAHYTLGTA